MLTSAQDLGCQTHRIQHVDQQSQPVVAHQPVAVQRPGITKEPTARLKSARLHNAKGRPLGASRARRPGAERARAEAKRFHRSSILVIAAKPR